MGLQLGSPFSSHMVLQRGRRNALWGWDTPEREIALSVEGQGVHFVDRTQADPRDGRFVFDLPELRAGGPYVLSISGSSALRLEDVLVGEVWIASGQSNMEWPLALSSDAEREIAEARHPLIRFLFMPRTPSPEPLPRVDGHWQVVSPDNVGEVTAVGYFFARELHRALGVPVGFVDAAWGGTRVEAWASRRALERVLPFEAERARYELSPEERPQVEREHAARVLGWERASLPPDPGNLGEARGWADPELDTSSWRELRVPGSWQAAGLRFNGVVWYRKLIELPAHFSGADLSLSLGAIDDFDHTYFNGVAVGAHPSGTVGAHQIRRRYSVPASLVRPGCNVVAVRVFDHFGEGGMLGPAQELYAESLAPGGGRVALTGPWRIQVEREVPLVPGDVFASYPATPEPLQPQNGPSALFNGMIAPLVPMGIAGALFYQGESNAEAFAEYRRRFTALIRDWRTQFGQGQFPFYYVQLAAYAASAAWPRLREAQAEVASEPGTAMACTLDIGERGDIHPRNKRDVGRRLAALALHHHYGRSDVVASGPCLSHVEIRGGTAWVHFKAAEGLTTQGGASPSGFELAASDLVFHPAVARIHGQTVSLESGRVRLPVAVRYAFKDFLEVNLVNAAGLPAQPFRTDCD